MFSFLLVIANIIFTVYVQSDKLRFIFSWIIIIILIYYCFYSAYLIRNNDFIFSYMVSSVSSLIIQSLCKYSKIIVLNSEMLNYILIIIGSYLLRINIEINIPSFIFFIVTIRILKILLNQNGKNLAVHKSSGMLADSSHWYIYIKNCGTYEIFKNGGITKAKVIKQNKKRLNMKISWYDYLYIPFMKYGLQGWTKCNEKEADFFYDKTVDDFGENYNSSFNSCQEFCSLFLYNIGLVPIQSDIKLIIYFILFCFSFNGNHYNKLSEIIKIILTQ